MAEKITFEEALNRLDEIAGILENGSCNLDEALELYTEAAKWISFCNKKLSTTQSKIEKIMSANLPQENSKQDGMSTVQ